MQGPNKLQSHRRREAGDAASEAPGAGRHQAGQHCREALLGAGAVHSSTFALSRRISPRFLQAGTIEKHVMLVTEIPFFFSHRLFRKALLEALIVQQGLSYLKLQGFKYRETLTQEELSSLLRTTGTECNVWVTICFSCCSHSTKLHF